MPRPPVYDEGLRIRLVAAAAAAMARAGISGMSLRGVAAAGGTSTNAVYTLFGGKDELVGAVLEEAAAGFTAAQRAVPHTDDALADLTALGHAYRSWSLEHPALYAVLMGGRVPMSGHGGSGWTSAPTARPLVDAVCRAVAEGLLVTDDPEQVAVTLWAGVHGMVTLEAALWSELPMAERDRRFDEHLVSLACGWMADSSTG